MGRTGVFSPPTIHVNLGDITVAAPNVHFQPVLTVTGASATVTNMTLDRRDCDGRERGGRRRDERWRALHRSLVPSAPRAFARARAARAVAAGAVRPAGLAGASPAGGAGGWRVAGRAACAK